jgi:hypothetical protein
MQQMSKCALELWKENLPLEHIWGLMRLEGYSLEELSIVKRWVNERWVKQRKPSKRHHYQPPENP